MSKDSTAVVRFIELQQQKPIFDPDAPRNVDTQVVKRPLSPAVRIARSVAIALALLGTGFGIGLYVGQNGSDRSAQPAAAAGDEAPASGAEPASRLAPAPPSQPAPAAIPVIEPIDDEVIEEIQPEMEPEVVEAPREPEPERAAKRDDSERAANATRKKTRKKKTDKSETSTTADPRLGAGDVEEVEADDPAETEATSGTLAVSAKPPCQIYIDGRNTGLKTPQRSIQLTPGRHRITLINAEHRINRSFNVTIAAGKTSRLVRDMMKQVE